MSLVFAVCAACSVTEPTSVYDACAPLSLTAPSATDAQLASIDAAIAAWAAVGVRGPTRAAADATVTVTFEPAASAFYGYYDSGAIYVNDDLADDARTITLAHELGHALGLAHVTERASVMNPGNLDIAPTGDDAGAIIARWGECSP